MLNTSKKCGRTDQSLAKDIESNQDVTEQQETTAKDFPSIGIMFSCFANAVKIAVSSVFDSTGSNGQEHAQEVTREVKEQRKRKAEISLEVSEMTTERKQSWKRPSRQECISSGQDIDEIAMPAFVDQDELEPYAKTTLRLMRAKFEGDKEQFPPIINASDISYARTSRGLIKKIGHGYHGLVYLARLKGSDGFVTVKLVHQFVPLQSVITEAIILQKLNPYNVTPKLQGLALTTSHYDFQSLAVVTDFIGNPITRESLNLNRFMKQDILIDKLPWLELILDLLRKLEAVHKCDVILCDLKSDNVLIQKENGRYVPYLIDVGGACAFGQTEIALGVKTEDVPKFLKSHWQIAPEIAITGRCSSASDVYSFASMMKGFDSKLRLGLAKILNSCLKAQPNDRPTVAELIDGISSLQQSVQEN